jgi:hypothetical protein
MALYQPPKVATWICRRPNYPQVDYVKTPAPHGRFLFVPLGDFEACATTYRGGTFSISFPANTGVECGAPSGEPPACSTVTA